MNWEEYQNKVLGFVNPIAKSNAENLIDHGLMGLAGEAGESLDLWKKVKYQGHELDKIKLALELGDVLFSIAETAEGLGFKLEDIAVMNIDKLSKRYITGKFTVEESVNRNESN